MPHRLNSILIATLGSKAQIITLTLDLLRQGDELPGEVVVVHTRRDRPETGAALVGSYGLSATIVNTTSMYVRDDTPAGEARYRARFYFDPNSITTGALHRMCGVV